MKVAIVHDWLVNYGGAERVVEEMLRLYPDADLFTLVYDEARMGRTFPREKVRTSFVQRIPFSTRLYTKMLTLMPRAFESFDLSGYDLVLCSSSCCAKGVITPPSVPHVAYIHSPMRYAWDLYFDYRRRSGLLTRLSMPRLIPGMRLWDFASSQRIDALIANSAYIARRIEKYWRREAAVVHPPVDTERLTPNGLPSEDFYVVFSRFVPYKRIDIAIDACGSSGRRLVVVGGGAMEKELRARAERWRRDKGADITFAGRLGDAEVRSVLQRCRALIFPAEEDFGIIPVEAQACGRPVVAFGRGGAVETVDDGRTGVLFGSQDAESAAEALGRFERLEAAGTFRAEEIAAHAARFSAGRFRKELSAQIGLALEGFRQRGPRAAGEVREE